MNDRAKAPDQESLRSEKLGSVLHLTSPNAE